MKQLFALSILNVLFIYLFIRYGSVLSWNKNSKLGDSAEEIAVFASFHINLHNQSLNTSVS